MKMKTIKIELDEKKVVLIILSVVLFSIVYLIGYFNGTHDNFIMCTKSILAKV